MSKFNKLFDLKLGYICNCNCLHCFIADRRNTEDLTFEGIKKVIDEQGPGTSFTLTGGEPTIRPDIIKILEYIDSVGCSSSIQTNGLMFADKEFTRQVAKYVHTIIFTLHSHIPEIHNKIVNSHIHDDPFSMAIQGLKNLSEYNIRVDTQTLISKINYTTLLETCDFIQELVPDTIMRITYPHIVGNAAINYKLQPTYTEIAPYIQKILKKWHKNIFTTYIPTCYIYPYQDLRFGINNHDEYGNLDIFDSGYDKSIGDGYIESYTEINLRDKIKPEECNQCVFNNRCLGIWKAYNNTFGRMDVNLIKEIDKKLIEEIKLEDEKNKKPIFRVDNIDDIKKIKNKRINVETDINLDTIDNLFDIHKALANSNLQIIEHRFIHKNNINENYIPTWDIYNKIKKVNIINNIVDYPSNISSSIHDIPYCAFGSREDFIYNSNLKTKGNKVYFDECEMCILKNTCDGIFKDDYEKYGIKGLKAIK